MTIDTGDRPRSHQLVLALVALVLGLPLFAGRVLAGQDIVNYLIIAQQTAANLREGIFLPSWAGGFNAGFGSPLLVFFPPLTGWVNAIPILLGVPVITGVCSLALVAHLLSGVAIYFWLRSIDIRHAALPAAIVYMVAPYRLINLYLRSALAEHWAFIWPPLILWIAADRRLRPPTRVALLAATVGGFLLTNIPLAVLFGLGLAAWFLASKKLQGLRSQVVAGAGLGFGLAAFMLVPQALASRFLNLDICFGPSAVRLRPSANTLFSAGFGTWNLNTVFSLVLLSTFAIGVLAYALLSSDRKRGLPERSLLGASVFCVLVTLGPAGPVWDALPILSNLQFPWRITSLLTLLTAVMVARLEGRRAWLAALVAVCLAIPFASWDRTVPKSTFSTPEPATPVIGTVLPDPHVAWEAGSGGWYWRHQNLVELCLVPLGMEGFFFDEFRGVPTSRLEMIRNRPAVMIDDSAAIVRVLQWDQVERRLEVVSDRGGTLLWRTIWFPDMEITVDESRVEAFRDPKTGLIANHLPPGSHVVSWRWNQFRALLFSRWISAAALAAVIILGGVSLFRRRRDPSVDDPDGA